MEKRIARRTVREVMSAPPIRVRVSTGVDELTALFEAPTSMPSRWMSKASSSVL